MNAQLNPVPSALDAYHEAAKAREEIFVRSHELQNRIAALQPLQDKRDAAKAELDKIIADEAAALAEWAKAGAQGSAPQPDTKARHKASMALADAEQTLTAAGAARDAIERELMAVNESIAPAQKEVRAALAHVIGEEYVRACESYDTALASLWADQMKLDTMRGAMHGADQTIASGYVNEMVNRRTARQNQAPSRAAQEGYDRFVEWCRDTFGASGDDVVADLNKLYADSRKFGG